MANCSIVDTPCCCLSMANKDYSITNKIECQVNQPESHLLEHKYEQDTLTDLSDHHELSTSISATSIRSVNTQHIPVNKRSSEDSDKDSISTTTSLVTDDDDNEDEELAPPPVMVANNITLAPHSLPFNPVARNSPKSGSARGEDLHLIHQISTRSIVMAVFDGVGAWTDHGVDPTDFSSLLLDALDCKISDMFAEPLEITEGLIRHLLVESYINIREYCQNCFLFGTTTATITFVHENVLHILNLGDSQCLVFRRDGLYYDLAYASRVQEHQVNTPFQMGIVPLYEQCEARGINSDLTDCVADDPSKAEYDQFLLEEGDIILVVSDGLIDNLDTTMMQIILEEHSRPDRSQLHGIRPHERINGIVDRLMKTAKENAMLDRDALRIGKDDDITVLAMEYID